MLLGDGNIFGPSRLQEVGVVAPVDILTGNRAINLEDTVAVKSVGISCSTREGVVGTRESAPAIVYLPDGRSPPANRPTADRKTERPNVKPY